MYSTKDLIREAKMKVYYQSLSPGFTSSVKVSATLPSDIDWREYQRHQRELEKKDNGSMV